MCNCGTLTTLLSVFLLSAVHLSAQYVAVYESMRRGGTDQTYYMTIENKVYSVRKTFFDGRMTTLVIEWDREVNLHTMRFYDNGTGFVLTSSDTIETFYHGEDGVTITWYSRDDGETFDSLTIDRPGHPYIMEVVLADTTYPAINSLNMTYPEIDRLPLSYGNQTFQRVLKEVFVDSARVSELLAIIESEDYEPISPEELESLVIERTGMTTRELYEMARDMAPDSLKLPDPDRR